MFIKWLKSSEKCEHSTRFRKLRKISIFWDFSKKSLFKLNFKIEVLAKWTVVDLGLFRTVLIQIMMSYLERLMSFIPVQNFQPVNRLVDQVPRLVAPLYRCPDFEIWAKEFL